MKNKIINFSMAIIVLLTIVARDYQAVSLSDFCILNLFYFSFWVILSEMEIGPSK